jgi:glycosyltransferase involved in cell wall biosynthesis
VKVLFLVPYPYSTAASQRFRFEQYFEALRKKGMKVKEKPFISTEGWKIMYSPGDPWNKVLLLAKGFLKRVGVLIEIFSFDFVFIHRECSPIGFPFYEWILAKVLKKKIIYDFDDAIWLTDRTNESRIERSIRWRSKVKLLCKWSYKVSAGNKYLADYARKFNNNVLINPTTIDTVNVHNPAAYNKKNLREQSHINNLVIGWTGSHSTLKYLEELLPVLKQIEDKYPEISVLVIADRQPTLPLKNLIFKRWSEKSEIEDLMLMDIGIMPLHDDEWTKGKCGFKALQYMALEIPAVVSPVGVNTEIVEDGIDGYWCKTTGEWFSNIERLILNKEERVRMGKLGRKKVIEHYSVESNSANFLSLFQEL